ncbi:hypothetical protein CLV59_101559 [Chitinophaga dinghuensis]|uniref:Uncharacterized protein n=1 Tax=Chitinophaga dinghuensis TaxID=1539050 RepID=A0A327WCE3_9BACT|nr:hypothetical protein [Chitinophaga dinghuensis]RAJ87798.1 hypothetical protein CLV59_101559 [Chitinophaga dinghuensis]
MNYLQYVKDIDVYLSKGETPDSLIEKKLLPELSTGMIYFIAEEIHALVMPPRILVYIPEFIGVLIITLTTGVLYAINRAIITLEIGAVLVIAFLIFRYFKTKNARSAIRGKYATLRHQQLLMIATKAIALANK